MCKGKAREAFLSSPLVEIDKQDSILVRKSESEDYVPNTCHFLQSWEKCTQITGEKIPLPWKTDFNRHKRK